MRDFFIVLKAQCVELTCMSCKFLFELIVCHRFIKETVLKLTSISFFTYMKTLIKFIGFVLVLWLLWQ